MSEKNTKYVATLTLTQDGLEGDVMSSLKFSPLIDGSEADDDGAIDIPAAYALMAVAVQAYLEAANILGPDGEILDEDEAHATMNIDASTGGGRGKVH